MQDSPYDKSLVMQSPLGCIRAKRKTFSDESFCMPTPHKVTPVTRGRKSSHKVALRDRMKRRLAFDSMVMRNGFCDDRISDEPSNGIAPAADTREVLRPLPKCNSLKTLPASENTDASNVEEGGPHLRC